MFSRAIPRNCPLMLVGLSLNPLHEPVITPRWLIHIADQLSNTTLIYEGCNKDEVQFSDTGEGSESGGLHVVSPPVYTKNVGSQCPTQPPSGNYAAPMPALTRLEQTPEPSIFNQVIQLVVRTLTDFTISPGLITCLVIEAHCR